MLVKVPHSTVVYHWWKSDQNLRLLKKLCTDFNTIVIFEF